MKLRNKKTGEIATVKGFRSVEGEIQMTYTIDNDETKLYLYCTPSLTTFTEEWQDYEEPEEYWCITGRGNLHYLQDMTDENDKDHREIGNYFETKEQAEKAVEKLKAWHKLIGYWETEILGWEIRDMPTGGNWQTVNVKFNIKARKEPMELLDLLFGGEE